MAYCVYCGKKLEEGETCNCRNVQNDQNMRNYSSVQNSQDSQNSQVNVNMNGASQPEADHTFNQNQGSYNQESQSGAQQYQESFNQAKKVSGIYLQQLLGAFIGIYKQPVTQGKAFVASGNAQLGVGFLVIQAILSSLFALAICSKINNLGKMASSFVGGGDSDILRNCQKIIFKFGV